MKKNNAVILVVAAVAIVAIIIGIRLFAGGGGDSGDNTSASNPPQSSGQNPNTNCETVTVVSSTEKSTLLTSLADAYNRDGKGATDAGCYTISVKPLASGAASEALASGWDANRYGPQPDVWTPASSVWQKITEEDATKEDQPQPIVANEGSIAQTPLVIAMPKPMAEALGYPKKSIGWGTMVSLAGSGWGQQGHPEWGAFKLGKTNPYYSTSGLSATLATYYALTGLSGDLTERDVNDKATRQQVKQLEDAVVHYGDTTLTFLNNMLAKSEAGNPNYVSAVAVEEKSVHDYNAGSPDTVTKNPPPKTPLVGVVPSDGTLISDNPWLTIAGSTPGKTEAGNKFLGWLREPAQQQQFVDAGFRTWEGKTANGDVPKTKTINAPSGATIATVQAAWDEVRKPGHILFVVDTSGSMEQQATGGSRMEIAKNGLKKAVEGISNRDEIGLVTFSTDQGPNGEPWKEQTPIALGTKQKILQQLGGLYPDGGTALYATLREFNKRMKADLQAGKNDGKINAIVLISDGQNEYSDDDLGSLLNDLYTEDVDKGVRVFTIGYSQDADASALKAIAEKSSGAYYDATDPRSLDKALTSVISNF